MVYNFKTPSSSVATETSVVMRRGGEYIALVTAPIASIWRSLLNVKCGVSVNAEPP